MKYLLIVCLLAVAGCNETSPTAKTPAKSSSYEASGSTNERIVSVTQLLFKDRSLASPILDAQFVEEKRGDGQFGPSDYQRFFMLQVAPQNLSKWTTNLEPLHEQIGYVSPTSTHIWWVEDAAFNKLEFFKPDTWVGSTNGWIGVARQTGHIYLFTFTM